MSAAVEVEASAVVASTPGGAGQHAFVAPPALTVRTALLPVAVGLGLAAVLVATAMLVGLPAWVVALSGIAGAGLGFLAVQDARTMLVLDRHNLVFFLAAVVGVGVTSVIIGDWLPLVFGFGSGLASLVFLFLVALASRGGIGGGDLKLVGSVGLLLGAFNPLMAIMWLLFTFVQYLVISIWVTLRRRLAGPDEGPSAVMPMVTIMATGAVPAVAVTGHFLTSLGLT